MKIVLKKVPEPQGHVRILEIDSGTDKVPSSMTYESEEAAIKAAAQYLGLMSNELDEIRVRELKGDV